MTDARIRTRVDNSESVTVRLSKRQEIASKPTGFWYSVNHGWEEWCETEMSGWTESKFSHVVELGKEKMLFIRDAVELDAFHKRYVVACPWDRYDIDWPRVSQEYDGIEIAPYIWERRLSEYVGWYYSWDCASGCIWRPKGVRVVNENKLKNPDKVLDAGSR